MLVKNNWARDRIRPSRGMTKYLPALSIVFLLGIAMLAVGQAVPDYQVSEVLSLIGGALLIVVAIRALASLAGLHQGSQPRLDSGEQLLVESDNVWAQTRTWIFRSRRGPYRARLTSDRILLSLNVMRVLTRHDVTVAWLRPGRPQSVRAIRIRGSQVSVEPWRRLAGAWLLTVPNGEEWERALASSHPELLLPAD